MKTRAGRGLATLLLAVTAGWRCGPATSGPTLVAVPPGQQGGVPPAQVGSLAEIRIDLGSSLLPDGAGKLALLPNLGIRF